MEYEQSPFYLPLKPSKEILVICNNQKAPNCFFLQPNEAWRTSIKIYFMLKPKPFSTTAWQSSHQCDIYLYFGGIITKQRC